MEIKRERTVKKKRESYRKVKYGRELEKGDSKEKEYGDKVKDGEGWTRTKGIGQ